MSTPAAELWANLTTAGLTAGEMPPADDAQTPWYVRVMLGIAGWIAATFLFGFVGIVFVFVAESAVGSIAAGLMVIAGAYAVFRSAPRSDFASMFALAVSFAGQAFAIMGIVRLFGADFLRASAPLFLVAALEAALAILVPNFIHRVASAWGAGVAFALACGAAGAAGVALPLLAAAVAAAWLNETRHATAHATLAPIGYGLTLAFIQVEATGPFRHALAPVFLGRADVVGVPLVSEALVVTVLVVSVGTLMGQAGWRFSERRAQLALAAVLALGAVSLKASGIAAGLMLVLLGFANGNRVLCGLGIIALLFYASTYYYLLDATLLVKSGVLAATSAVLVAMRWLVLRFVLVDGGHEDA